MEELAARIGAIADKLGVAIEELWPVLQKFVVFQWVSNTIILTISCALSLYITQRLARKAMEEPDSDFEPAYTLLSIFVGIIDLVLMILVIVQLSYVWIPFFPEIAAIKYITGTLYNH